MTLTWAQVLMYSLLPFGDILGRIFCKNGSVDNLWTLFPLFQLPLFGLVPLIMMKNNTIKNGKLKTKPYDSFIILSIIIRLATTMASRNSGYPNKLIIDVVGTFVAIYMPILIRIFSPRCNLCKKYGTKSSIEIFIKSLAQASIIQSIIVIFSIAIPHVPYVGSIFSAISSIPIIGETILFSIFYLPFYSVNNMINENNLKKFCKGHKYAAISGIVGFVLLVMTNGAKTML